MKKPAISVIIPVYKAENYLHKCVDSLLAQTFTDFEVILVDDGSSDRSGAICDEYSQKDSRVKVIHKENGGVSSARQCGIDNAQGEYTIHADPDDWVENNMLEELYRKAKKENADMVICDYYKEYGNYTKYIKQQPPALDHKTILCELLLEQLHGSCWNKLIRRTYYKRYNIHFPFSLRMYEDLFVTISIVCNNPKISYLNKAFYHYDKVTNLQSITKDPTVAYTQLLKLDQYLRDVFTSIYFQYIYSYLLYKKAWLELTMSNLKELSTTLEDLKNHFPPHAPLSKKVLLKLAYHSPLLSKKIYDIIKKHQNKHLVFHIKKTRNKIRA